MPSCVSAELEGLDSPLVSRLVKREAGAIAGLNPEDPAVRASEDCARRGKVGRGKVQPWLGLAMTRHWNLPGNAESDRSGNARVHSQCTFGMAAVAELGSLLYPP